MRWRLSLLVFLAACKPSGSSGGDKVAHMKARVAKLAAAYESWSMQHPGKGGCPSVLDLAKIDGSASDKDDWGNPIAILCGDAVPPSAGGPVAIMSNGPDGKSGTDDDIKSW